MDSKAQRAAVIGLGSMGLGMAISLIKQGWNVAGCDVSDARREKLTNAGGTALESPAAAAVDKDVVICVVVNAQQTEAVLFGDNGVADAMNAGSVFISCATMNPDDVRRLASRLQERDIHYLDAPISGGAKKAASGDLSVMASGSPQAFDQAAQALDIIAEKVYTLGDEPGIGASFKMINQLLAGVHIVAACEAMTLASKLGLDLPAVYEVIRGSAGNSWMFENRVPHILDGDYSPNSTVEIFIKDMGIVQDMTREQRFAAPLSAAAMQMYLATSGAGMGRDDDSSVARLYAQLCGINIPS